MGPHPHADQGHLGDLVLEFHASRPNVLGDPVRKIHRLVEITPWNRKGQVGQVALSHVLNDHIHENVRRPDRSEDPRGNTGMIGHTDEGDLRLIAVAGDPGDHDLFHIPILLGHQGPVAFFKSRLHDDRHLILRRKLDRSALQHLGAQTGQFQHFLVGHLLKLTGGRNDIRVRGKDSLDVGIDEALLGAKRGRQGDSREIRSAAPQGRDVVFFVDALKSRYHRNDALIQSLFDSLRRDPLNARPGMSAIGHDADLPPGIGAGIQSHGSQGHRKEGDRNPFTGGQEHVHLALVGKWCELVGQLQQAVRLAAHSRHDDHDRVARLARLGNQRRHMLDALDVSDRRPPKFLHYQHTAPAASLAVSSWANSV